jgi:hypothetical protein
MIKIKGHIEISVDVEPLTGVGQPNQKGLRLQTSVALATVLKANRHFSLIAESEHWFPILLLTAGLTNKVIVNNRWHKPLCIKTVLSGAIIYDMVRHSTTSFILSIKALIH